MAPNVRGGPVLVVFFYASRPGLLDPGPWSLAPYLNRTIAKDYRLYEIPVSRSRSDNR